MTAKNIHPVFDQILNREHKERLLEQKSMVVWFTGLSGAGKTTLAINLERKLYNEGFLTQVLDGDNIRSGINNNLSFTEEDRKENVRRIAEISKLLIHSGLITLNSFISPTEEIRDLAKQIIGRDNFFEVFVNAPLAVCEERDVKGLYQKARDGKIKNFSGIDSPFDHPVDCDIEIRTDLLSVEDGVDKIWELLEQKVRF